MKKFKIISDPKTGQTIFIPPSILSDDWWLNQIIAFREKLYRINVRIWNGGLLLWWYRLWIRKDEFHQSLDIDSELLMMLKKDKRKEYLHDLKIRRDIAHQRDFPKSKLKIKYFKKSRPENSKTLDEAIDEILAKNQ